MERRWNSHSPATAWAIRPIGFNNGWNGGRMATDTATTSAAAVTAVTAVGDGVVTGPGLADGVWAGIGDIPYDYGYYYPNAGDYYYSYAPSGYVDSGTVVDSGVAAASADSGHIGNGADDSRRTSKGPTKPFSSTPKRATAFLAGRLSQRLAAGQAMPPWTRRGMPRSTN